MHCSATGSSDPLSVSEIRIMSSRMLVSRRVFSCMLRLRSRRSLSGISTPVVASTWAKPLMALRGVRTSCVILCRNDVFACRAASARSRAIANCLFCAKTTLRSRCSCRFFTSRRCCHRLFITRKTSIAPIHTTIATPPLVNCDRLCSISAVLPGSAVAA